MSMYRPSRRKHFGSGNLQNYQSRLEGRYLPYAIQNYPLSIKNKNGVKINDSVIPKKNVTLTQFEADNIIKSYDEFAESVLGEDYKKISNTRYEGEKGFIDFFGDKFDINIEYDGNLPAKKDSIEKLFQEFNLKITDFEYREGTIYKKSGKYDIYDCNINLKKEHDILKISGVWYEKNSNKIFNDDGIKPITSALIDFLSDPLKPQGQCEIINIKLGYMVYETTSYHKSIVPMPVWEFELSNNKKVYISARAN